MEDQPGATAVAHHERRPDVGPGRAAVDDVEPAAQAGVVERVRHPAGVGAAHPAPADDQGDPGAVRPAAAVTPADQRAEDLVVTRQRGR